MADRPHAQTDSDLPYGPARQMTLVWELDMSRSRRNGHPGASRSGLHSSPGAVGIPQRQRLIATRTGCHDDSIFAQVISQGLIFLQDRPSDLTMGETIAVWSATSQTALRRTWPSTA
jgi:hypothetical protein